MNGKMMAIRCGRQTRGFTLIEIMVVVAVITVLASIAIFMGIQMKRGSAEKATKATFSTLDSAMGIYLKDNREPTLVEDTIWVLSLKSFPASAGAIKGLKFSEDGTKVLDGFNNPIVYHPSNTPPLNSPHGLFQSYGPDGLTGAKSSKPAEDDMYSTGAVP